MPVRCSNLQKGGKVNADIRAAADRLGAPIGEGARRALGGKVWQSTPFFQSVHISSPSFLASATMASFLPIRATSL